MLVILVWVFFAMPLVTGQALTPMAVLYWLMGYPQAKIADWIHRKFKPIFYSWRPSRHRELLFLS